jgi:hypothetical protein
MQMYICSILTKCVEEQCQGWRKQRLYERSNTDQSSQRQKASEHRIQREPYVDKQLQDPRSQIVSNDYREHHRQSREIYSHERAGIRPGISLENKMSIKYYLFETGLP